MAEHPAASRERPQSTEYPEGSDARSAPASSAAAVPEQSSLATAGDAEGRWARLQRLGRDVADRLRHRAEVSRLRTRMSRLEARVEEEKTRVGRALYPLVEEARITVELPEVQEGVERIAHLREEMRRFRDELEELERSEEV